MERIELGWLEHTVERTWVAQPVQGRQPVISIGRLADGRWWAGHDDGHRWTGAWACGDEHQAEEAAHRWSERSRLRWRRVQSLAVSRSAPAAGRGSSRPTAAG